MIKSRVFRSLFKSYIIVLSLPMILCAFVFYNTGASVNKQLEAANNATLSTLRDTIDATLKDAYSTVAYMITNEVTLSLKNTESLSQSDVLLLQSLKSRIRQYVAHSSIINNLYVCLHESGTLIDRERIVSGADAQNAILRDLSLSAEVWDEMLSMDSMRAQHVYTYRDNSGRAQQQLILMQKDNKAGIDRPGRVIVIVQVNMNTLREILRDYTGDGDLSCFISYNDHQFITASNADAPGEKTLSSRSLISLPSSVSSLTYMLAPSSGIQRMTRSIIVMIVIYYLICFGVGIGLVWHLSKRNYSPLQKLLTNVLSKLELTHTPGNDEYAAIEKAMLDTLTTMRDSNQRMDTYRTAGRNAALRRLLRGHCTLASLQHDDVFEFSFLSDRFCVALYSLENINLNLGGDEGLSIDLIDFIVTSMIQEFKLPGCRKFAFPQGDMLACLINLPAEPLPDERTMLEEDARRTLAYLAERMSISTIAGISRIHSAENGLHAAYYEARNVLTYMHLIGLNGQALHIEQMNSENPEPVIELSLSLDIQRRLLSALRENHFTQAAGIHEELISLYFGNHLSLTSRQVNLRLSTVIDILISAFNEMHVSNLIDSSLLDELYNCSDLTGLKHCADQIFTQLTQLSDQPTPLRERDQKIIDYIRTNFTDPNLNLNSVADAFRLSPSYCGQLIRRCIGYGASDYIQQLRVELAKQKLANTTLPLKEIAELVGFGSSLNLIRAFKRQEGITPSAYRELAGQ